jgi:hypothetical protein
MNEEVMTRPYVVNDIFVETPENDDEETTVTLQHRVAGHLRSSERR